MKHPLHPLIVHFPIAAWSLSTLGDIAGIFIATNLTQAIGVLMLIGCVSAIIAMAAGVYEIMRLNNIDSVSNIVDLHMYAAVSAWCFYLVSLYIRWDIGLSHAPDLWALSTSVLGFIVLMIAGWYGGNLVYVHGVGTQQNLTK